MEEALVTPFAATLGARLQESDPKVRRHHECPAPQRFRGSVRVRPRGLAGRVLAALLDMGAWRDVFRPSPDGWIPFELENRVTLVEGRSEMIWRRTLHFPGGRRGYEGRLSLDRRRRSIIDSMSWLVVELDPVVENGTLVMTSRRQWIRIGRARLPLPARLVPRAETREWVGEGPDIHLSLAIRCPVAGEILRYDAVFRPEEAT